MQFTLATVALVAATAVSAQGVTSIITPSAPAPSGCVSDYSSHFEITVVLPAKTKRDTPIAKRDACPGLGTFVGTLKGGVLHDALGRIGEIVANDQFQFDGPPAQAGSIYTGGWSICPNSSLALGGSTIFYQCSSNFAGQSGVFYNLYDKSIGSQCQQVLIDVIPCGSAGASQATDGQVQATSAGQHITQISDGQIQATSAVVPVSQFTDGQLQKPTGKPVSQFTDGQLQVPTSIPKPVSQYTDGQLQAPSATVKPVSQYTDGQLQAPTATVKPVSQYTDGQLQAPTVTGKPVSQYTDGQLQAPTATGKPVSQYTDGQLQAPNATASATRAHVTNAAPAMTMGAQLLAGVVAVAGFAML